MFIGGVIGTALIDTIDIYNSLTGNWFTASMKTATYGISVPSIGTMIFVAGGYNATSLDDAMNQIEIFNVCTAVTDSNIQSMSTTVVVVGVLLASIIIVLGVVFALWKFKKNLHVPSNQSSQNKDIVENQVDQNKTSPNQSNEKELPFKVNGNIYSIFPEDSEANRITTNSPTTPTIQSSEAQSSSCVVCLAEEATFCLVPCGHMCVCHKCSSYLTAANQTCPLCRHAIQGCMKVYKN